MIRQCKMMIAKMLLVKIGKENKINGEANSVGKIKIS